MAIINFNSISGINTVSVASSIIIGDNFVLDTKGIEGVQQLNVTGVVTASSFVGDGSTLTGIDATALKDTDGNVIVQAEASGINVTGVSTFSGSVDVTGHAELDNVNIAGVSTFTGNIDANGDLDVDGHAELDNVNISGVLTATSAEFSGNVTVLGDLTYENVTNLDSVGVATARSGLRITGGGLDVVGVSTFSSDLIVPDKIIHAFDTDTAIRFPAGDTFTVETAGIERVRVANNGRIGVGTISPLLPVHVEVPGSGTSDAASVLIKNDSTSFGRSEIQFRSHANNGRVTLVGGAEGSGAGYGTFDLKVWDNSGLNNTYIRAYGESYSNYLSFWTGSAAVATNTEKMRITKDGNIGIGTDNPQGKLTVSNGSAGLEFNPNSEQAIVSYNRVTSTYTPIGLQGSVVSLGIGGVGEALRITSSGNIGIGTFIPTTKFEVGDVSGGVRTPDFSINTVSTASSITIGRLSSVGGDNTSFRIRDRVDRTILYTYVSGVDVGQSDYSSTNLNIKNGNLVFSTSGTGIDFSATSDGSGTASSELLDDYEEGTCTLYLATSSKTSQISSSGGTGITYTKIGRKIHIYGYIVFNNIQSTLGSNHVHLWGFPYNFSSLGNSVDNGIWMWTNGTAPTNYWNGRFPGISQIINNDGGGVFSHGYNSYSSLTGNDFGNSGLHFNFDYTYQI